MTGLRTMTVEAMEAATQAGGALVRRALLVLAAMLIVAAMMAASAMPAMAKNTIQLTCKRSGGSFEEGGLSIGSTNL